MTDPTRILEIEARAKESRAYITRPDAIEAYEDRAYLLTTLRTTEARVAKLEEALKEIAGDHQSGGYQDAYVAVLRIARAALEDTK